MRDRSKRLGLVVLVAITTVVLLGGPPYSRRYNSCAICRLGRLDYSCVGVPWSIYEETECTRWYREHIERAHEHMWVSGSTETERNIDGTVISIADGDARALFMITPSQQIEIYKHIPDAKEARRFFEVVGTDKGVGDSDRRRRIQTATITLREWAKSGFAEDWDEVRPRLEVR